jgi:hypothetical protein
VKRVLSTRRVTVSAGAALVAIAFVTVNVALGTPPTGTVTPTTLASVTTVNTVNTNLNGIKFRNENPVQVVHVQNAAASVGWSSGWHSHTRPVFVSVTEGTLTFYERRGDGGDDDDGDDLRAAGCRVTTVTAPGGFIEPAGKPMQVRNEGPGTASWITTLVTPVGGSLRVDVTPGFCGV